MQSSCSSLEWVVPTNCRATFSLACWLWPGLAFDLRVAWQIPVELGVDRYLGPDGRK